MIIWRSTKGYDVKKKCWERKSDMCGKEQIIEPGLRGARVRRVTKEKNRQEKRTEIRETTGAQGDERDALSCEDLRLVRGSVGIRKGEF